jgi:molybdopterin molybdotransferase
MISVDEALDRILKGLAPVGAEAVSIAEAAGRVLAEPVLARITQPPVAVSAMDGWAVRAGDVAKVPATLARIGESAAGRAFAGQVGPGQAVRIFTGAPLPDGADTIVIQENTAYDDRAVTVRESAPKGRYVREAGLDFRAGDPGIAAPKRLGARDVGLAAAMNAPWAIVRRRPRVALLATGDELVRPGEPIGPAQIVSSNGPALAALVRAAGGEPFDLGIARDTRASLLAHLDAAKGADLLVTIGGASVGEHDLIRQVYGEKGLALDFWQVAMRPGKPLMSGRLGDTPMIGLPGNPVSALVCALVFLRPAIAALLGLDERALPTIPATLGADLAANDARQDYLRASLVRQPDGTAVATAFERQDSSNLARLARAECLIVRAPNAPVIKAGAILPVMPLSGPGSVFYGY